MKNKGIIIFLIVLAVVIIGVIAGDYLSGRPDKSNPNPYASDAFPSQHPALMTVIWVVIIVAIFAPLGIRKYRSLSR